MDTISSEYDHMARSSIFEREHGLGPTGLDRIRQPQPTRVLTLPNLSTSSLISQPARRRSLTRSTSSSRAPSTHMSASRSSVVLEDLHRFPSESLHSFSFAQQSEELLQSRQNILKRSIDFMRDRFGWAATNPAIVNAQARLSGDPEMQSMMYLLSRANVMGNEDGSPHTGPPRAPVTGPADVGDGNVFDKAFIDHSFPRSEAEDSVREHSREHGAAPEQTYFLSPMPKDDHISQRRERKSAPSSRRVSLKPQPYTTTDSCSLTNSSSTLGLGPSVPGLHTHSSKWTPVSQAVFRTEAKAPWTILAANDLSCLIFGFPQSEIRRLSILKLIQKGRRQWLESRLLDPHADVAAKVQTPSEKPHADPTSPRSISLGKGITAQLLSKPSFREKASGRAGTDDSHGSSTRNRKNTNHSANKSRGVLLCGDVVPIKKRNGSDGSASVWVMEKHGGLIWVMEEITEDVAYIHCDDKLEVTDFHGNVDKIWGPAMVKPGLQISELFPRIPKDFLRNSGGRRLKKIAEMRYLAGRTCSGVCIPVTITEDECTHCLRVASFPHIAGMMALSSSTLKVISSNSVFSSALFGQEQPKGLHITELIPGFDKLLRVLIEEDQVPLTDGIVVPEQSFRRARTLLVIREGNAPAASIFAEPPGLRARHRDGSTIAVDVQLRVVKSGTIFANDQPSQCSDDAVSVTELVYALWITYSRHIHAAGSATDLPSSPPAAPSPRRSESPSAVKPVEVQAQSTLSQQLREAASEPLMEKAPQPIAESTIKKATKKEPLERRKRTIDDYVILEDMGQGAYGQVKLARLKSNPAKKMVLKYVTKKKILVDTWTRDRRLGTVPLEIHAMDYLRRDGLKHPNIVEMEGFFEDDINYYIEMTPHGLPGMDLFDYIELKANMEESECRNIFRQVADAIHHLHTKALVVHRDIKDENVILDGEGRIKLIDFGSAAYIKNGPFDVFVGTIDYAAPEVLQGKPYRGKEQDIWALGILLYTIVYKENPFYNVDEILDHPLRVPYLPFSEDCIDLIRKMLDRDVDNRLTIGEVMDHPWMTSN
ncbi:hypothetical protein MAP00_005063 [Monascus purpureus]|nr:hypothetical protein MAP00_005063 [Monascus purpureus]